MQARHVPTINARYWAGITLASIFGTNMGDLYAHDSGLGLLGGLPILIGLFLAVYAAERFDRFRHDAYYWICIVIMRTGATNIADYLAGRRGLNMDKLAVSVVLGVILAAFALWSARAERREDGSTERKTVPVTNPRYWTAMLVAGVFGTVFGDFFEHLIGQGLAAVALGAALALARCCSTGRASCRRCSPTGSRSAWPAPPARPSATGWPRTRLWGSVCRCAP